MRIPDITHLQFLVLDLLVDAEVRGRDLRRELARYGVRRTAPAFYQMMARLETAGLADGAYDQKLVGTQMIKERRYRITAAGEKAWRQTREFYLDATPRRRVTRHA